MLEPRATKLRVLAIAEAEDTVTADHLLQMACLAAEHKPTVLGIPGQVPIPCQLECTVVLLQSLHALSQLLTSGSTMQHCPQAASFAVALGTAARHDNGHIVSMAASLALALRSGRSTLAVAGVFGAGKTPSLTFLLAWLALTTHLKIAVVHKENPAGRAITQYLPYGHHRPLVALCSGKWATQMGSCGPGRRLVWLPQPLHRTGRAQPKKSRKSPASTSRQPLDSVPEHAQPPATLNDLASRSAPRQETPARRNPETPPDCPSSAQERPEAMTEIDIVSDQEQAERGGTAATDLQLESEQRAMQTLYNYQKAAGATREAHGQKVPLPSRQIYSDLPREWPMARLAVSSKQINRLVRTFLWRRVTEQALHGSSFTDIPDEINQAYIGDLLLISEAFAAPLSNLFAFVKNGHPACPFIPQKQLALYANPRF